MPSPYKLQPLFKYTGGKHRNVDLYPKPRHSTIIEPFAGSAGYACRYPNLDVILIDTCPVVGKLWTWLIKATEDEIMSIPCPPKGALLDSIEYPSQEAELLVRSCTKTWGAAVSESVKYSLFWDAAFRARVARQLKHIRHWRFMSADYYAAPDIKATWFIDPPYQAARLHMYPNERVFNYSVLADWCKTKQGQVIACDGEDATWLPFRKLCDAQRGGASSIGKGLQSYDVKPFTEGIWTNY